MSEFTVGTDADLVQMVADLRVGGTRERPFRHQAILLLWALGRVARREPRLTHWSAAQAELRDLMRRFGHPDNRPTPEYPFVALAQTPLWDLAGVTSPPPSAHGSRPLTWLNAHDPLGGLPIGLHRRLLRDIDARDVVVTALVNRFFPGQPMDELLAAVHLAPTPGAAPGARLDWTWDELVLACDLLPANGWHELPVTDQRVLELSSLLRLLPIHPVEKRGPRFRSPDSVRRKMVDIATQHPDSRRRRTNGNKLDKEVLDAFLSQPEEMHLLAVEIRSGARSGEFEGLPETDGYTAAEGRLLERRHVVRERDPRLREKKIRKAVTQYGCVECEACGFDFARVYGDRGVGYAECHHAVPLHASGETRTRLQDLVLLCANCHRMIHRRTPWLTPDELRAMITTTAVTAPRC